MSNKAVKVPTLKSGNDAEAAAKLTELVADAQNGLRRIVALGLFCFEIKAQLKHGKFKPWLAVNCKETSYRSLAAYMQLTAGVLQKCGTSAKAYMAKVQPLHFSHSGELLLLADAKVPEEVKPLKDKICSIIDGKSQAQLFLDFKQADEDEETDQVKGKRGNLKSTGREPKQASPEQLLAAQQKIARENIEAAIDALGCVKGEIAVLPPKTKEDRLLLTTYLAALEQQTKAVSLMLNKSDDPKTAQKIEELFKA
jgi:hypothetical protein